MSTGFWIAAIAMAVLGALLASWPLLRQRRPVGVLGVVLVVTAGVIGLYPLASNYAPRSPAFQAVIDAESREALAAAADALTRNLEKRPDDYLGWRVLGNGRLLLGEYPEAIVALRQAMERATAPDPGLMLMLGDALSRDAPGRLPDEVVVLYIGAYQLAPDNPDAMFAAGLGFAAQGNTSAAADVWERLMRSTEPPADVRQILSRQIELWRGAEAVAEQNAAQGTVLDVEISLDETLARELPSSAKLFVSVRDPQRPGPPLAARQFPPSSLPLKVRLSDADAMLVGRNLSSAESFVVMARVSMSGDPMGGAGDWLGITAIDAADLTDAPLSVLIDEVVGQ